MMRLSTNILGSFVLRDGKIVLKKLFPDDVGRIAASLGECGEKYCQTESDLIEELISTGNTKVEVDYPHRFMGSGFDIDFIEAKERVDPYELAVQANLSPKLIDERFIQVNELLTTAGMREVERDMILIQNVGALDDLDEVINRLIERLREWYSIHFPELDDTISNHQLYTQLVFEVGHRSGFEQKKIGVDDRTCERIKQSCINSLGVDFTESDVNAVKNYAEKILDMYKLKAETETYIEGVMAEVSPNLAEFAGALLGARLIALAHGLKRLSTLPAGTIQILGAEDAFFRFLKTGKNPPKHGIIFQYPDIRGAPRHTRGKLARTFAAKAAIASRADAFKGKQIAPQLIQQFKKRVQSLK